MIVNGIELCTSTGTKHGSSRISEYQRCHKAHGLKYRLHIFPRIRPDGAEVWETEDPKHFDVGHICHSVLEYVQQCVRLNRDPEGWNAILASNPNWAYESKFEARRLMGAYWQHYGFDNAGWKPGCKILEVEAEFRSEIGYTPRTARVDTLLGISDRVVVVDHKTRAKGLPDNEDRYIEGLRTRPQLCQNSWLVRENLKLDYYPDVMLNFIVKTKIPKFERLVVPMGSNVDRWLEDQKYYMVGLDWSLMTPNYSACAPEVGSRCTYFKFCHGNDREREMYFETKGEDS